MLERDRLIRTSYLAVRTGWIVNRLFLAAVVLGLLLSWALSSRLAMLLLQQSPGTDVHAERTGLRLMLLLGTLMAVAIERLLVALMQTIESARAGDPFSRENAGRLRTAGWALLALQLFSLPAALIERSFPGLGTPESAFSLAGWLAVLLVFLLSRVFAVGSSMRDELEGMV